MWTNFRNWLTNYRKGRVALFSRLNELGSSADDIALHLIRLGIVGVPGEEEECPIAWYLKRYYNIPNQVYVFATRTQIGRVSVQNPVAVAEFIENFDEKMYPQLIRGGKQKVLQCGSETLVTLGATGRSEDAPARSS